MSVAELYAYTKTVSEGLFKFFDSLIITAENAAIELVNQFVDEFDVESVSGVKYDWMRVEYLLQGKAIDYAPVAESEGVGKILVE